ncbi:hypothetical protein FGL01_27520 [Flavobacterium glycines]|uniref:Uncharacterized protein n=3 Tax=Flavobacterium glycines TaxID=551990 RepID=A0A511CJ42_9FLAO|nr:hypothetical protein FGL01_27520 [Flavobacterium glycines]
MAMIYLLWGLLNIILFLFFITICFKATRLIREKVGLLASIIFVFGLLSFMGHSNDNNDDDDPNKNQVKTWNFISKDNIQPNTSYFLNVDLEKTLISKFNLEIICGKNKQNIIVPISAYSLLNGFVSGINWKPTSITINNKDNNNKFEYLVYGTVEWKLLNLTIYSQRKEYKGFTSKQ